MRSNRVWIWIRNTALILVILAFVAVFGLPQGGAPTGAVAEVNGEQIRRDVFEFFRDQTANRNRDLLPADMDPAQARNLIDNQTMSSLIHRTILVQEAEALGLRVSDEELAQDLATNPSFVANGRFDPNLFERSWRRAGLESERVYMEELRRDLLIRKFQRIISSPVHVSDAQARETLERERVRVRLRYAIARGSDFREGTEISEVDVQAFVETQQERLQAAYQARLGEFRAPETVHVRHILFSGEEAVSQASAARERLLAGEDFAELARELSRDDATRLEGGDLGSFPRGRMLAAFEEAAFALEPGAISEPVKTESGVHLILLEERSEALERTLEQASEELARELLREDLGRERARQAAEEMLKQLQNGTEFTQSASALGLSSEETTPFGARDFSIPGIGRVAGLKQAALRLTPEQPLPGRVFRDGESFYVVSLLERDEPDAETLAAELLLMRERLETQARGQVLAEWSDARRGRLQQGGKLAVYPLYPAN